MRTAFLALAGAVFAAAPAWALTAVPAGAGEGGTPVPAVQYYRPDTTKVPYSQVVRVDNILYVSGQLGVNPDGKPLDGMAAQAKAALDHVAEALGRVGSGMDAVFKCTVMLTDMGQWAAFNQVYVGYFKPDRLPARSAMAVSGLPLGSSVEVECWAYAPTK
ncbi:MAG: RidA family protein [Azospirillaceae bacterium]|nr:RidA family protein [Azospirillaceae bacterium]